MSGGPSAAARPGPPRRQRHRRGGRRHRLAGQGLTEYLLLGSLVGLALVIGDPSPLEALVLAIQQAYGRTVMGLSLP